MIRTTTALATLAALGATSLQAADLRMSWWGGDSRHLATQEALKVCGEKHGHTVQAEFTGWSGHQEKITTQMAGRTEADIMQINWPWLPLFTPSGEGFADLNQFAETIDLSQWTEDQLASGSVGGKLNGLPISTTGRVIFFNKTQFDRAGLAVPTTWEEVLAAGPVFKEKLGADYYPFEASGLNALFIVSLVATQATGKDLIDPETSEVAWTPEELTAAIEFYQSLVDAGAVRAWQSVASEGNIELFESPKWASGEVAGTYEWDSTYSKYADPLQEGQELVAVDILTIDGAATEGVYRKPSMLFSISRNSPNPEAAAQIINCLLNEPEGITALGDSRGIPASKIAADMLLEAGTIDPTLTAANQIVLAAEGPTVSPHNEHPGVREVFIDTLEAFAYGQMTAEEAAEEIILGINEITYAF